MASAARKRASARPGTPPRPLPPFPESEGYVRTSAGRLYYRTLGDPRRPTVLVVHGGPSEHRYLAPLADLVPAGYRVVWYDQLGCGRSTRPRRFRGYSMEVAARHVEAVREQLKLRRPHLLGHSWGGAVALQTAVLFPRRYRSLIVCSGFGSDRSFVAAMRRHVRNLPRSLRETIERSEAAGRYDSARYRAAVRTRRELYGTGLRVLPYDFAICRPGVNRRLLRFVYGDRPGLLSPPGGLLRGWDVSPELRRLRLPSLVVSGGIEAGRYTARDLHRWLRGSRRVTFEGAAHLPFYQVRDRFMETLIAFLGTTDGRGRRGRSSTGSPGVRRVKRGRSRRQSRH